MANIRTFSIQSRNKSAVIDRISPEIISQLIGNIYGQGQFLPTDRIQETSKFGRSGRTGIYNAALIQRGKYAGIVFTCMATQVSHWITIKGIESGPFIAEYA